MSGRKRHGLDLYLASTSRDHDAQHAPNRPPFLAEKIQTTGRSARTARNVISNMYSDCFLPLVLRNDAHTKALTAGWSVCSAAFALLDGSGGATPDTGRSSQAKDTCVL
ncbi:hypothetical protein PMIN06_008821 [Paraphaeosphaeria minitans]